MTFCPSRVIYDHAARDKSPEAEREKTMTKAERNTYNNFKENLATDDFLRHAILSIKTGYSSEYKKALHELFTAYGFHPTEITTEQFGCLEPYGDEHINYTYGLTFKHGEDRRPWFEKFTKKQLEAFKAALE